MKQWPRIYYTDTQKALMWDRWRAGESLQTIARLFDRNHSSIQQIFAETGGNWRHSTCSATSFPLGTHQLGA